MILPDKNRNLKYSLLGFGGLILNELTINQTISSLWEKMRNEGKIKSYEKFILTLDFLYSIQLIEYRNGILKLKRDDKSN